MVNILGIFSLIDIIVYDNLKELKNVIQDDENNILDIMAVVNFIPDT